MLNKAVYGLPQAGRAWHTEVSSALLAAGYLRSSADPCVFVISTAEFSNVLVIHVDDFLAAPSSTMATEHLEATLGARYKIKASLNPTSILKLRIGYTPKGITVDQEVYCREMLKAYGFESLKPASMPLNNSLSQQLLAQTPESVVSLSPKSKRDMQAQAGSLLYAVTGSRVDLAQAVGQVCRHMHDPSKLDLDALKHIFSYLVSHLSDSLFFPFGEPNSPLSFCAYSDVSWNNEVASSHSTGGNIVCLATGGVKSPLVWSSHRQALVTRSVTEAEFVEASGVAQEAEWLRIWLEDARVPFVLPIPLFVDNQSAVALIRNPVHAKRTKHIRAMYHYIQQAVKLGTVTVSWCDTESNLADALTKVVPLPTFQRFISTIFGH